MPKENNNQTVIIAKNLQKHYNIKGKIFKPDKILKALDGVSFELQAGKTLAIVGESGCGKSTLARLITQIEPPTSGQLSLGGMDIDASYNNAEQQKLNQMVQIVFQDPYGSLNPRHKIGSILEEPLKVTTNMAASARKTAVMDMMQRVGLKSEHYNRYPHMFSGGQRQRIAIARALILKPKIVVLDEPVSALDVSIQAQVLNLLSDLQQEMNLAYLFISHDLSVVRHIADDILVMYLGRPVEQGSNTQIFNNPQHPYTKALLSATPIADPNQKRQRIKLSGELPSPLDPPSGCLFHTRCAYVNDRCKSETPDHLLSNGAKISCHGVEENRI